MGEDHSGLVVRAGNFKSNKKAMQKGCIGGSGGGETLTVSHFNAIMLAAEWRKMDKGPNRKLGDN